MANRRSRTDSKLGVNCLDLDKCDVFGFDLDHTLAKYHLAELFKITYVSMATHLVEKRGYSPTILEKTGKCVDFCCKGLVLDLPRGNVMKLDCEGHVIRCSHGTRMLDEEEIGRIYGRERMYEHFPELSSSLVTTAKYAFTDTYFDDVIMVVFARVVDVIDQEAGGPLAKYTVWPDIKAALNATYFHTHFSDGTSPAFLAFQQHPGKYLQKCSVQLKQWLASLKEKHHKIVFLMTSSYIDFASCVLEYILGPDWKDYFDICFTHSRKPSFFTSKQPFFHLDKCKETEEVTTFEKKGIYSQGNLKALTDLLQKWTNKPDPKVVYFGDSPKNDAFGAKNSADWAVVLVAEEMETEGHGQSEPGAEVTKGQGVVNGDCDGEPESKYRKREVESKLTASERDLVVSAQWGPLFSDNESPVSESPSRMNTFYGDIARRSCDLIIPHLDYIAELPPSASRQPESSTHALFYPHPPSSLIMVAQSHPS